MDVSDAAKELLAREGYDPAFGARPLKRAVQRLVVDPLAIRLLDGTFKPEDTVFVNAINGNAPATNTGCGTGTGARCPAVAAAFSPEAGPTSSGARA